MTSIPSTSGNYIQTPRPEQTRPLDSSEQLESEKKTFSRTAAKGSITDSVEISDSARSAQASPPQTVMAPEKALVPDSKAEKTYRDLMKKVKEQKSDIMSQIKDTLEKKGIALDGSKIKIEVAANGTIKVGGIKDKDLQKAVTKALNEDKTLAPKLREFQKDEKELSKLVKDYTGCSLYELTMTAKGDVNKRIRDTVEAEDPDNPPRDSYYTSLAFLGETSSIINVDDVMALAFDSNIDFSGELNTMAEPERNIKDAMKDLSGKISKEFGPLNDVVAEKAKKGLITDDMKARLTLDLSKVTISIDNRGQVTIDGLLAEDKATHERGVAIIKKLAGEMINDYDSNSYHKSIFTDASEHMINNLTEDMGEDGEKFGREARVVAQLANGRVGDVKVSAPKMEKELTDKTEESVNQLLKDEGLEVEGGVSIEVDESGRIRATNLAPDGAKTKEIRDFIDRLNKSIEGKTSSEEEDSEEIEEEVKETETVTTTIETGIDALASYIEMLKKLRA
ncbi:MAG: hypothetical protein LIQ31_12740 [Planctomycetes bacterium]|nr:hypothetical protein [Planctomycetota bacterium]